MTAVELTAPPTVELGRIVAFDPKAGTALLEVPLHLPLRTDLAGRSVLVRRAPTLFPTASGVISSHRAGRIWGVYVTTGHPSVDDEVISPAEP